MRKLTIIVNLILCIIGSIKADSWKDPTWEEMINKSDVIALVEYTSNGDFRAKAKPLKIYKGKINNEVWIAGFSNRFGPIDIMSTGDKYIVFLSFNKPTKRRLKYWKERVDEDETLKEYYESIKNGNSYYVSSPTSGDLKVKSDSIQYNLLQTTFYRGQQFYSLKEFENFLQAALKKVSKRLIKTFHNDIIEKINQNEDDRLNSQYLMMLYLSNFKGYISAFTTISKQQESRSCYALAKLLGKVKDKKSTDILVELLANENSIVQGEAVRQLSKEKTNFIGPILLSYLQTAGEKGIYPNNLMNPVRNSLDGGKIEIIRTLGEIKYKPAAPQLLTLLETKNDYLFILVIDVLQQLGSKDYIPYLNKHLENGTDDLIFEICSLIVKNDLNECLPALMNFIENHDKTKHSSKDFTISWASGLGHFNNDEVKQFLIKDFQSVLKMKGGDFIDNKKYWLEEYIETFDRLDIETSKEDIYNAMFEYYGYHVGFRENEKYFIRRSAIEDSLSNLVKNILAEIEPNIKVTSLVSINKNFEVVDYSIRYDVPKSYMKVKKTGVNLDSLFYNKLITFDEYLRRTERSDIIGQKLRILDSLIINRTTITNEHLILGTSRYSKSGVKPIKGYRDTLFDNFLAYISNHPNKQDLDFLENMMKFNEPNSDYIKGELQRQINTARKKLKNKR